jgi:hypothetical protein
VPLSVFGVSKALEDRFERMDPARNWSMYLLPQDHGSTRLILRSCIEAMREPTLRKRIDRALDEPIDFVMEQRMLRSVRRLAEGRSGRV